MLMAAHLASGYHRHFKLLKEHLIPSFENLRNCICMRTLMIKNIEIKKDILDDEKYKYLFSVEEMNKLVLQGMPLRDAYKKIGIDIENNNFQYNLQINHTHEGSIGNLENNAINEMMNKVISRFNFNKVNQALQKLLE